MVDDLNIENSLREAERSRNHRAMKEALWGLVGSVQNPVENPVQIRSEYSATVGGENGPRIARLTLTFEPKR